jgi:hypothetical protein
MSDREFFSQALQVMFTSQSNLIAAVTRSQEAILSSITKHQEIIISNAAADRVLQRQRHNDLVNTMRQHRKSTDFLLSTHVGHHYRQLDSHSPHDTQNQQDNQPPLDSQIPDLPEEYLTADADFDEEEDTMLEDDMDDQELSNDSPSHDDNG